MKVFDRVRRLFRAFVRDKHGRVVVWQFPNAPLIGWALCRLTAMLVSGNAETFLSYLGTGLLVVWACLEITKGSSYFRRTLGLLVLLAMTMAIIFA